MQISSSGGIDITAEAHVRLQSAYYATLTGYGGVSLLSDSGDVIIRASTDATYTANSTIGFSADQTVNILSFGDSGSSIQLNAEKTVSLTSAQGNVDLSSSSNNVDVVTASATSIDAGSLLDFSGVTSGISIISSTFAVQSTSFDFVSATRPFNSVSSSDLVFSAGAAISISSNNGITATSTNNIIVSTGGDVDITAIIADFVQSNGDLPGEVEINSPTIQFTTDVFSTELSNTAVKLSGTALLKGTQINIGIGEEGSASFQSNTFSLTTTKFQSNSVFLSLNGLSLSVSASATLSLATTDGTFTGSIGKDPSMKSAAAFQLSGPVIQLDVPTVSITSSNTITINSWASQFNSQQVNIQGTTAEFTAEFTNIYAPASLSFQGSTFSSTFLSEVVLSASSFTQSSFSDYVVASNNVAFIPNSLSSSYVMSGKTFSINSGVIQFFSGASLTISSGSATLTSTGTTSIVGYDSLAISASATQFTSSGNTDINSDGSLSFNSASDSTLKAATSFSITGQLSDSSLNFATSLLTTLTSPSATFTGFYFDASANTFTFDSSLVSSVTVQNDATIFASNAIALSGANVEFDSLSTTINAEGGILFFDEGSSHTAANGIFTAFQISLDASNFMASGTNILFHSNQSITSKSPENLVLASKYLNVVAPTLQMTASTFDFELSSLQIAADSIQVGSVNGAYNFEVFSDSGDLDFISQQFTYFNTEMITSVDSIGPMIIRANETVLFSTLNFNFVENSGGPNFATIASLHGSVLIDAQTTVSISTSATGIGPQTGDISFTQTGSFYVNAANGWTLSTYGISSNPFTVPFYGSIADPSIVIETTNNYGNIVFDSTEGALQFTSPIGGLTMQGNYLDIFAPSSLQIACTNTFSAKFSGPTDWETGQFSLTSTDFISITALDFNMDTAGAISIFINNPDILDNPLSFQAKKSIRFAASSNSDITFNFLGIQETVTNYTGFAGGQLSIQTQGNLTSMSARDIIFKTQQGSLTVSTSQATLFDNTGDFLVLSGGSADILSSGSDVYTIGRNFILSSDGLLEIGSQTALTTVFDLGGVLTILSHGDKILPQDGVTISAPDVTFENPTATTTLTAQAIVQLGSPNYYPSVTMTASGATPVFQLTAEGTFTSISNTLEFGTTNFELDIAKYATFNYLRNGFLQSSQTLAFNSKQGSTHLIGGDIYVTAPHHNILANKFAISLSEDSTGEILFNSNNAATTFNVQNANSLTNTWNINSDGAIVWNGRQSTVIKSSNSFSDALYDWVFPGTSTFQAGTGIGFTTTNYQGGVAVEAQSINIDDSFSSSSSIAYNAAGNFEVTSNLRYAIFTGNNGVEFHAGIEQTAQGLLADITFTQPTFTANATSNFVATIGDQVNLSGWDKSSQVSPTTMLSFTSTDTTFSSAGDMSFVSVNPSSSLFQATSAVSSTIQSNPGTSGSVSLNSQGGTVIIVGTIGTQTVGSNLIFDLTDLSFTSNSVDATGYGYGFRLQTTAVNGNINFNGSQSIQFNAANELGFYAASVNGVPPSISITSDLASFTATNIMTVYTANSAGDIAFFNEGGSTSFVSPNSQFFTTSGYISFVADGIDTRTNRGINVEAQNEVFIQADNLSAQAQKNFVVQSSSSDLPLHMGIFFGELNTYLNYSTTSSSSVQFKTTAPQADIDIEALSINIGSSILDQSSTARFSAIGSDDGSFVFQSEKNVKVFSLFNQQYFSNHPLADIEIKTDGAGSDVNVRGTGIRFESLQRTLVQTTSLTGTHLLLGSKGGANIFQQTDPTQAFGAEIRALNGNFVADAGTSGDVDFVATGSVNFYADAGITYSADSLSISGNAAIVQTFGGAFDVTTGGLIVATGGAFSVSSGLSNLFGFGAPGQDIFINSVSTTGDSWVAQTFTMAALDNINLVSSQGVIRIGGNIDATTSNLLLPAYGLVLQNSPLQPCLPNAIAYHTSPYVAPKLCACVNGGWLCYQFVQA